MFNVLRGKTAIKESQSSLRLTHFVVAVDDIGSKELDETELLLTIVSNFLSSDRLSSATTTFCTGLSVKATEAAVITI